MQDFDEQYNFGELNSYIYTVIEVSKGSMNKIEYSRDTKAFELDRIEPGIFAKPANYGFIPQTTDEDNDALDTLLLTDEPLPTGIVVKAKVVGVLNFVDGGENDHKILCVPEDDRHSGSVINDINDVNERLKEQIEHHFAHYKDLNRPGTTIVNGWGDTKAAWVVIQECIKRFQDTK